MRAEDLARDLGGHKVGNRFMARCPAHEDRTPSLAITDGEDGRILVHCFAGCSQSDVISALKARGLWAGERRTSPPPVAGRTRAKANDDETRRAMALRIWNQCRSAKDTPLEGYLFYRGLTLPVPPTIRFHNALRHPAGSTHPAMVAQIQNGLAGEMIGIHRTYLSDTGTAKAAVAPQRMMLGLCAGGAVRLAEAEACVMIGEGLETCMAAMQVTGLPAWAALSTTGLVALKLPDAITNVIILGDGDPPGVMAARLAAQRFAREGRSVRIAQAPEGQDFNSLLMAGKNREVRHG